MSKVTLSIDTDIDEQLKKVEELIAKCEELEGHAKKIHFVTIKEFAEMRRMQFGCCSKDFPITRLLFRKFWQRKSNKFRGFKKLLLKEA